MIAGLRRVAALALVFAATFAWGAPAAAHELTLGLLKTGTAQWELAAMRRLGIDRKHGLELKVRELAGSQAGQVALQTGAVDVILSDFVWVSLQRDRGNMVTFVPHSLAVGGLMVARGAQIATLGDLRGKTIAVAGTPVDKSWVILQADYARATGRVLKDDAEVRYGAPPLVAQLLDSGRAQAALNFWSWNAREAVTGAREVWPMKRMLADLGISETPPLLGWVFTDQVAARKSAAIGAFLAASFETKAALLDDDALWEGLRGLMRAGDDPKLFTALRDGYRDGIVRGVGPGMEAAAAQTFALLAKYGGREVVGDATVLAPGTFYAGYPR